VYSKFGAAAQSARFAAVDRRMIASASGAAPVCAAAVIVRASSTAALRILWGFQDSYRRRLNR